MYRKAQETCLGLVPLDASKGELPLEVAIIALLVYDFPGEWEGLYRCLKSYLLEGHTCLRRCFQNLLTKLSSKRKTRWELEIRREIISRPCSELFPDEINLLCYVPWKWKVTLEKLCVALLWFSKVTYTRTRNGRVVYCSHILACANDANDCDNSTKESSKKDINLFLASESKRCFTSFQEASPSLAAEKGVGTRYHLIEDFIVGGLETYNRRILYETMDGRFIQNDPRCILQQPSTSDYLLNVRFTMDDGSVSALAKSYICSSMIKYGLNMSEVQRLAHMQGVTVDHVSIFLMFGGLNTVKLATWREQASNKFPRGTSLQGSTESDPLFLSYCELSGTQQDIIKEIMDNKYGDGLPMVRQEIGYGWDDLEWFKAKTEMFSLDDQLILDDSLLYFEISEMFVCITKACRPSPITSKNKWLFLDRQFKVTERSPYRSLTVLGVPCLLHRTVKLTQLYHTFDVRSVPVFLKDHNDPQKIQMIVCDHINGNKGDNALGNIQFINNRDNTIQAVGVRVLVEIRDSMNNKLLKTIDERSITLAADHLCDFARERASKILGAEGGCNSISWSTGTCVVWIRRPERVPNKLNMILHVTRFEEQQEHAQEEEENYYIRPWWFELVLQTKENGNKDKDCIFWGKKVLINTLQNDSFGLGEKIHD